MAFWQLRNDWRFLAARPIPALTLVLVCGLANLRSPLLAQTGQAAASTVRGVVKTPLGYGAPGVTVWIHNRPTGAAERPEPLSRWVRTDVRGEFTFSQIPAGNYVLCADLPNSDYLSTCAWENPETFSVGTSGKTEEDQTQTIQLRRGKLLHVSIPDPKGTRHWKSRKEVEEQFQFSVQSIPMQLRHVAPYSLEYALLVPSDKMLRLSGLAKTSRFHSALPGAAQDKKSFSQEIVVNRSRKPFVLTIPMEGVSLPKQNP